MKKYFSLIIISILSSCISDNESKGINEIAEFYGGSISYSIGVNASTENELQGSFVELKINGFDFEKYYEGNYELPASNAAYLFYKNLNQSERKEYDFIRIILEINAYEQAFEFSKEVLESFMNSLNIMDLTTELILHQNYNGIISNFHPLLTTNLDSVNYVKEQLKIDNKFGKASEFSLQGFKSVKIELDNSILECFRISGVLLREKQNTNFSVTVDKHKRSQSILGIRYAK